MTKRTFYTFVVFIVLCLVGVTWLGVTYPKLLPTQESIVSVTQSNSPQAIAPAMYVMFDMPPVDYGKLYPERGPIGGVHFCMWEDINSARGVFNWARIDNWLALQRGMTVTLESGEIIPKPVMLMVLPYISSTSYASWPADVMFYDGTPNWVYTAIGGRPTIGGKLVGYVMTSGTTRAVVPMYDSETWRSAYYAMVAALGAKYEHDPQIAAVVIATGIDGETSATKSWGGDWPSLLPGGVQYRFSPTFVNGAMAAFRAAFPTKTILINNAPVNGINRSTALYAATFSPPIGIKNSGLWADGDSETGYGAFTGMFDPVRWYSTTLPIWLEPKLPSNAEGDYWMLLAGLSYHPDAYTLYPEFWATLDNTTLRWFTAHLGKTITTTPSIWTVFRDYEYPLQTWGSGTSWAGISGHIGDWEYWLSRVSMSDGKALRIYKAAMPIKAQASIYARQARRTDQVSGQRYIYLRMAEGVTANPVTVTVTYIDHGTDTWALQWRDTGGSLRSETVVKQGADTWVKHTFYIHDMAYSHSLGSGAQSVTGSGADLRVDCNGDGDETVHMVEIALRKVGPVNKPEIVATPTAIATPTATVKPSASATPKPTASATPLSTAMPSLIPTATVTTTPTTACGLIDQLIEALRACRCTLTPTR